jgi:hypothetical protein
VILADGVLLAHPEQINCDCGGVQCPAILEAFDMSAFVGHPVPPIRTPGYRCDKCQGETVDGTILNAYMAGFNAGKGAPVRPSYAELLAGLKDLMAYHAEVSDYIIGRRGPVDSSRMEAAHALIARAGG